MKISAPGGEIDLKPTKIVAVATNYRLHCAEMGSEIPEEPKLFLKPPSALLPDGGTVLIPAMSQEVHHEVELGVVIGRRARKVKEEEALSYVFGYTIILDMTARDIQLQAKKKGGPWGIAKGFDTFAPLGPRIVSPEKFDPSKARLWLKVNDIMKQESNTGHLIFPVSKLISFISCVMTLEPMDIIATGTPEGVGPVFPGDVIQAGIDGIGTLRLTVAKETGS